MACLDRQFLAAFLAAAFDDVFAVLGLGADEKSVCHLALTLLWFICK